MYKKKFLLLLRVSKFCRNRELDDWSCQKFFNPWKLEVEAYISTSNEFIINNVFGRKNNGRIKEMHAMQMESE